MDADESVLQFERILLIELKEWAPAYGVEVVEALLCDLAPASVVDSDLPERKPNVDVKIRLLTGAGKEIEERIPSSLRLIKRNPEQEAKNIAVSMLVCFVEDYE